MRRRNVAFWPDAELRHRQLLARLFGVKRTRYARACYFRV
jgi:hypothetical protein